MQHFTSQNGLTSNTVYNLFQDSKRFIWFCTDLGISRFDGHSFQNFTSKDGLPDNEVFKMAEDKYGRLWLWLYNHRACYIFRDKIYTAANDRLCRKVEEAGLDYNDMFFNKKGEFCLGGHRICIIHKDYISFYYPELLFNEELLYYFLHNGSEYVIDPHHLYKIEAGRKISLLEGGFSLPFYQEGHIYLLQTKEGGIKYFNDIMFTKSGLKIKRIRLFFRVYGFVQYNDHIWWHTGKGLIPYNLSSGRVNVANAELQGIPVTRLMKDQEDNTWFTTINDGVYMRAASRPLIINRQSGLAGNNVLALHIMPSGELVAGHDNGMLTVIRGDITTAIPLGRSACYNKIRYMIATGNNELMAGSDYGLFKVNIAGRYGHTLVTPYDWGAHKAGYIKGNYLLFGSTGLAGCYNLATRKTQELYWWKTTTAILVDSRHTIWLGTLNGLYCKNDHAISKWERDSVLSHSRITSLALLGKDGLAISTYQNGLFIREGERLYHIIEGKGISSDICQKVIADSSGYIWVCNNSGLDKIRFVNGKVEEAYHFSQADGFFTNDVHDIAFGQDKTYVATSDGIIVLSKDHFNKPAAPKIYILSVHAKHVSIPYPGSISLDYSQNNIQVAYTGISYTAGKDITYKYLLEGSSKDTIYTPLSSLNLSAVKPGTYTLYVWAASKDKQWSLQPASFSFVIHPPFWMSIWFLTGVTVLGMVVLYAIYKKRINSISSSEKEKTEQAKRMAALEMQALRAQINPHFMFNALNAIQHYYSRNDERKANYYMTSFATLIRQTLTHAKTHWLTVSEEITMLKTYIELEQMRFDHSFEYEIRTDPDLAPQQTLIPAMLLQPYVENAINHGLRYLTDRRGLLLISFEIKGNNLCCRIDDNGVGFQHSSLPDYHSGKHKSMGMAITRHRIETINQLYNTSIITRVTDKQSLATSSHGIIIEIILPLNTQL